MSIMNTPEDQAIIRYLLGDLGDSETEKIEQRYFCDSSFDEHVGVVEDLLIRGFLDKSLSARDLGLFEGKYLKVPELREKVAFARRLHSAALGKSTAGTRHRGLKTWRDWSTAILPPAFAAVGLICLVASLVIIHNGRKSGESRLPKPTSEATSLAPLEQLPDASALSVVLLPGVAKGSESRPFRLILHPEIKEVRLELDVPGVHEELMARVEILLVQNDGRKLVWSHDHIPSVPTPHGRTVLVALKSENLASGDYILYVEDSSQGQGSEPLRSYVFSVVRP